MRLPRGKVIAKLNTKDVLIPTFGIQRKDKISEHFTRIKCCFSIALFFRETTAYGILSSLPINTPSGVHQLRGKIVVLSGEICSRFLCDFGELKRLINVL